MRSSNPVRLTRMSARVVLILSSLAFALTAYAGPEVPDAGRDEYPLDDAVVLRLDEHWSLLPDGSLRYEYHRWLKLLSDRAFRREGDPRIGFRDDTDKLEIITARTHRPDGEIIDVPDYSFNLVSPDATGGMPAFADDRQWVVSYSALMPDAVLEMHYVCTSKPGARKWLWGDVRLRGPYPIVQHNLTVTLPAGQTLRYQVDDLPEGGSPKATQSDKTADWTWQFEHLEYCGDESSAPDWRQRCGRLRFTNTPSAEAWAESLLGPLERAAVADQAITDFIKDIADQQVDARSQARAIAKAVRERFNFIRSDEAWWGRACRSAGDIFAGNYGTAPEVAALLTAMYRAAGLKARPMLAVDGDFFDRNTPVDSSVQDFVIAVTADDATMYVDAAGDIVYPAGAWIDRVLLSAEGGGGLRMVRMSDLPGATENRIAVRADIEIDPEGKAAGVLRVHLTGRFADFEALRENDAAKSEVSSVLSQTLEGFKVEERTDSELLVGRFTAEAKITSKGTLPKVDGKYMLTFAEEAPHSPYVHLPLTRTERESAVHLPTLFSEDVHVVIKYPEKWKAYVAPVAVPMASGPWGGLELSVADEPGKLVYRRELSFQVPDISPKDFAGVRDTVNLMRADAARHLLIGPPEE
jgi:hypothetical protein